MPSIRFPVMMCVAALALACSAIPATATQVNYTKGKGIAISSDDGNYRLNIGAYGQFRATYTKDSTPILRGRQPEDFERYSFDVYRLRLDLQGHVLTDKLTYRIEADFAKSFNMLNEGWLNYAVFPALQFRGGKFKGPYNRQFLTSSSASQFVEGSWVNGWPSDYEYVEKELSMNLGYQTGFMVHGMAFDQRFEYAVSATNGTQSVPETRLNAPQDINWVGEPLYLVRVAGHPLGYVAYDEPDLDITTSPKFAIGVAYGLENETFLQPGQVGNVVDLRTWVADFAFRWQGASINAEYHSRTMSLPKNEDAKYPFQAFLLQAGYLLPFCKRKIEVVGRYAGINFDDPEQGFAVRLDQREKEFEYGGGVNYYFSGHTMKASMDYLAHQFTKNDDGERTRRTLIRVQFQYKF